METTREIALRTYKCATEHGMMDTPMNWHIWKRAFDTAERELKNLQLGAVSVSLRLAQDLLKAIECSDPNLVNEYEASDLVLRDLYDICKKLVKELSQQ